MTEISAILLLKTRGRHYVDNIGRCDILFSSLRHFAGPEVFSRILVIVPPDEVAEITGYARAWSDFPIEVVDESVHMRAFVDFNKRHQIRPWHRQQIIKLHAAELVDTEFFMVFDPDVFATHPFGADTLVAGGRALTHYESRQRDSRYWVDSGKLLQQEPHLERDGIWQTPAILSRTLCRSLHRRLQALYGTDDWMRVLLANYTIDWTEYTLYWLNAEREGLLDQYHLPPAFEGPTLHAEESVWHRGKDDEGLNSWNADWHFGPKSRGLFAVIQSNTHIPVADVAAKLGRYFPVRLQEYERRESLGLKLAETYSALTRRGLRLIAR